MGYLGPIVGDVQHEGWVVPFFADGAESAGSSGSRGILVDPDSDEWRPDSDVVGWRAGCECGWRGPTWMRVTEGGDTPWIAPAPARGIHNPGLYADLDDEAERAVINEWQAHIAPHKLLEDIEEANAEYVLAGRRLDALVADSHTAGASWADIGRAVGITRQSARERWGDRG